MKTLAHLSIDTKIWEKAKKEMPNGISKFVEEKLRERLK